MSDLVVIVWVGMAILQLLVIYSLARILRLALIARRRGLAVTAMTLMWLEVRGTSSRPLVEAHALAQDVGVDLSWDQLITWAHERLPVLRLATALSTARKAGLDMNVATLLAHARAGGDPLDEVTRLMARA